MFFSSNEQNGYAQPIPPFRKGLNQRLPDLLQTSPALRAPPSKGELIVGFAGILFHLGGAGAVADTQH
jgi:hypothetical protein